MGFFFPVFPCILVCLFGFLGYLKVNLPSSVWCISSEELRIEASTDSSLFWGKVIQREGPVTFKVTSSDLLEIKGKSISWPVKQKPGGRGIFSSDLPSRISKKKNDPIYRKAGMYATILIPDLNIDGPAKITGNLEITCAVAQPYGDNNFGWIEKLIRSEDIEITIYPKNSWMAIYYRNEGKILLSIFFLIFIFLFLSLESYRQKNIKNEDTITHNKS